ncbi:unnamed protein product [Calicophoron daubneyi]|uniref:Uncharacterized protein n=1 Tax=Calicophoron daubneyi TaxID=300641 RepID=A0AAV2TH74_CALDB
MFTRFSGSLLLLLCVLTSGLLAPESTDAFLVGKNGMVIEGLQFSAPCPEEGHRYHDITGNFMCTIPNAKECFAACQKYGCTEWFFTSLMSSSNDTYTPHYRCRCIPQWYACLYNLIPHEYRGYEHD